MIKLATFDPETNLFTGVVEFRESQLYDLGHPDPVKQKTIQLPKGTTETIPSGDPSEGFHWSWNKTSWVEVEAISPSENQTENQIPESEDPLREIIDNWYKFIQEIRVPILRPIQDVLADESPSLKDDIRDAWKLPPVNQKIIEEQHNLWNEALVYPSVRDACEVEIQGTSRVALFARELDKFNIPLEIDPISYELRIIPE